MADENGGGQPAAVVCWSPKPNQQEMTILEESLGWWTMKNGGRGTGACVGENNKRGGSKKNGGTESAPCMCVAEYLEVFGTDYTQNVHWQVALQSAAGVKKALEKCHPSYYDKNTTTNEEFLRLDIEATSAFCRYFVPSLKKNSYWTVVDVDGTELYNFCNSGLSELMGGKTQEVDLENAKMEIDKNKFVLVKLSNQGYQTFERYEVKDKTSKEFKMLFGEDATTRVAKKQKASTPHKRTLVGKTVSILTPWGAFFKRIVDQNMPKIAPAGMLAVRRREGGEEGEPRIDPSAGYLNAYRLVHMNHVAVSLFEMDMAATKPEVQHWDLETKTNDKPAKIYSQRRPQIQYGEKEGWKKFGCKGQEFDTGTSYRSSLSWFRMGLEDCSGKYKKVLVVGHDVKYKKNTTEKFRQSLDPAKPVLGQLVHTGVVTWVESDNCLSYEIRSVAAAPHGQVTPGRVNHFGNLAVLELDKAMLSETRNRVLDSVGPDYSKEFLGNATAAAGGFRREEVTLYTEEDFDYFVEYRGVKAFVAPEAVEGQQAAGNAHGANGQAGGDDGGYASKDLSDLFLALGCDGPKLAEVAELQTTLEDLAVWTSTTGKLKRDQDLPDTPANKGLRRGGYVARLQHARVCGVRDYRDEEALVVQVPGLPYPDEVVRGLKGSGEKEAYEIIVPLDGHGLLVWMAPRRAKVAIGNRRDAHGNNIQLQDDDKTLMFVKFGSALLIPVTTHYSTFHRSSMTGSPHIKAVITVKAKTGDDEGPYLMDMPLMGNVAAGYTSPVGLCMPPYPWKFIDGKSQGKLRKIFDQAQGNAINGDFGCHLPVTAMFLFAGFCLPAKMPEGGE